jgi:hypothetical protein
MALQNGLKRKTFTNLPKLIYSAKTIINNTFLIIGNIIKTKGETAELVSPAKEDLEKVRANWADFFGVWKQSGMTMGHAGSAGL